MAQKPRADMNSQQLKNVFLQTHHEALRRNEDHSAQCSARYNDYMTLRHQLQTLPDKLTHEIMVPIGNRALMRGKLVHTNEILVHLGDGWFVKQSAKLALDICDRRIASHGDMLNKLETERTLLTNNRQLPIAEQAFENEIVEEYNEQAEAEWRARHKQNEKDYRQKLAKERHSEKEEKEEKEDIDEELWEKLDRLELQEELEEELERMKGLREREEPSPPESKETQNEIHSLAVVEPEVKKEDAVTTKAPTRRISFGEKHILSFKAGHQTKETEDSSDEEPLRIEFTHTKYQEPSNQNAEKTETITSPADIYKLFPKPQLKSILKRNTNYSEIENSVVVCPPSGLPPSFDSYDYVEEEVDEPVAFGDIVERPVQPLAPVETAKIMKESTSRPVSRFKASRK